MTRRSLWSAASAGAVTVWAAVAVAAPALITTRPALDPDSGECVLFVGGINDHGRSLKASSIEVLLGGSKTGTSPVTQALSDWAQVASERSQAWRPPLAAGLVYLWVEGVPSGVLDGIHAFFGRIPSRTPVFPTVYGRMRQGRARLSAADISRLDEVPHLEAYKPNLIEAVRLDLSDFGAHPAPIKILLIVTDGRDFSDPKGQAPGDFATLGREIRKAGITPLIVGFPPPEADAVQSAANLRELHDAGGGFLKILEQADELENTLESMGQAVGDLQRVQFPVPWSLRALGGSERVSLRLMTGAGQRLNADAGTLDVAAGPLVWLLVAGIAGLALVIVAAVMVARRRKGGSVADEEAVVTAAHDLIRRGVSPQRAVEELTRSFGNMAGSLQNVDPEVLNDPQYPYFRTRPGRLRMQEIRDLLANKSAEVPALGAIVAEVLAATVTKRSDPDQAAEMISARAAVDEWTAFAGMELEQLAEALRGVVREHPVLGTPRARGVAVAVQDALRTRGSAARGIAVGWLVRANGPGRRGETLRLQGERTVIGARAGAGIQLGGDPAVAPEHAELGADAGEFAVSPLGGAVSVEGAAISGRHVLSDGETIQIGAGLFVFKSASAGNLVARSGPGAPAARPSRRRRVG